MVGDLPMLLFLALVQVEMLWVGDQPFAAQKLLCGVHRERLVACVLLCRRRAPDYRKDHRELVSTMRRCSGSSTGPCCDDRLC